MKIIRLLFTHNFNEEKANRYIKAFEYSQSGLTDIKIVSDKVTYRENGITIESYAKNYHALILTGGKDINPLRYNEKEKHPETEIIEQIKELIDFQLIENFLKEKKPILGICLGCQELNVFFGGTLYQDIPEQFKSNIHKGPNNEDMIHNVLIEESSLLYKLIQLKKCNAVSHHHQGIKDLAKGLKVSAISPEDNLIEGIEMENSQQLVFGVQWHPERDVHKNDASKNLFKNFVKLIQNASINK